ncbi:hypothetical protein RI367_001970 [Sorochytrium milnesiophthora]
MSADSSNTAVHEQAADGSWATTMTETLANNDSDAAPPQLAGFAAMVAAIDEPSLPTLWQLPSTLRTSVSSLLCRQDSPYDDDDDDDDANMSAELATAIPASKAAPDDSPPPSVEQNGAHSDPDDNDLTDLGDISGDVDISDNDADNESGGEGGVQAVNGEEDDSSKDMDQDTAPRFNKQWDARWTFAFKGERWIDWRKARDEPLPDDDGPLYIYDSEEDRWELVKTAEPAWYRRNPHLTRTSHEKYFERYRGLYDFGSDDNGQTTDEEACDEAYVRKYLLACDFPRQAGAEACAPLQHATSTDRSDPPSRPLKRRTSANRGRRTAVHDARQRSPQQGQPPLPTKAKAARTVQPVPTQRQHQAASSSKDVKKPLRTKQTRDAIKTTPPKAADEVKKVTPTKRPPAQPQPQSLTKRRLKAAVPRQAPPLSDLSTPAKDQARPKKSRHSTPTGPVAAQTTSPAALLEPKQAAPEVPPPATPAAVPQGPSSANVTPITTPEAQAVVPAPQPSTATQKPGTPPQPELKRPNSPPPLPTVAPETSAPPLNNPVSQTSPPNGSVQPALLLPGADTPIHLTKALWGLMQENDRRAKLVLDEIDALPKHWTQGFVMQQLVALGQMQFAYSPQSDAWLFCVPDITTLYRCAVLGEEMVKDGRNEKFWHSSGFRPDMQSKERFDQCCRLSYELLADFGCGLSATISKVNWLSSLAVIDPLNLLLCKRKLRDMLDNNPHIKEALMVIDARQLRYAVNHLAPAPTTG